jgi:tetratricopeptide (TPR) repeat protein
MEKRLDFRFEIPKPPGGPLVELSAEEAEKMLLKKLDEDKADPTNALWQLAQCYKLNKQHEKALERLRQLILRLPDPESKAECIFTMGQAMEQVGDYEAAVRYYKEDFREDVECCREAIKIAANKAEELKPVVHRGWRKSAILLWSRLKSILNRLRGRSG